MGYTHYKNKQRAFTLNEWNRFTAMVRVLFAQNASILAGPGGDAGTKPEISTERVMFNGIDDESHETCVVTREANEFEFCKTARKPYDAVVVAVWKAAREVLGPDGVKLSSDGGDSVFAIKKTNKRKDLWKNDGIQFPRLIAEAQMAGVFNPQNLSQMAESMDLELSEVKELIDRACDEFDSIKSKL